MCAVGSAWNDKPVAGNAPAAGLLRYKIMCRKAIGKKKRCRAGKTVVNVVVLTGGENSCFLGQ